jgi:hypothetical protein
LSSSRMMISSCWLIFSPLSSSPMVRTTVLKTRRIGFRSLTFSWRLPTQLTQDQEGAL